MNVLSLFAGIGGLELGLEQAGMATVGQVELDRFCRSVLAAHWPEVPRHDDVRTAPDWWASQPRPRVDVVAGGFPCQPFSNLGLGRGVGDPTDGVQYGLDGQQFDPRSLTGRELEIARALLRYAEERFADAEMNPLVQRMAPP